MMDRIILLDEGTITESGTFDELISRNGDFVRFIQQHLQEGESDDDDEDFDG